MWGEMAEPAGYVHMLMVDRNLAGHGIGRAMLSWAEQLIADSGRRLARLDCVRSNRRLRTYYESAGTHSLATTIYQRSTGRLRPPSTRSLFGGDGARGKCRYALRKPLASGAVLCARHALREGVLETECGLPGSTWHSVRTRRLSDPDAEPFVRTVLYEKAMSSGEFARQSGVGWCSRGTCGGETKNVANTR